MFKKGDKVIKTLTGFGATETEQRVVHSVKDGVVYLVSSSSPDRENGVTYNMEGEERERFFLPMVSQIRKAP